MIVAVSLHKTHIRVVKSLVKIAAVSWHSLRRFIKPAPVCHNDYSFESFPFTILLFIVHCCIISRFSNKTVSFVSTFYIMRLLNGNIHFFLMRSAILNSSFSAGLDTELQ